MVDTALFDYEAFPQSLAHALTLDSFSRLHDATIAVGEPFTKGELLTYSSNFVDDMDSAEVVEEELLSRVEGGFHSLQGHNLSGDTHIDERPFSRFKYQSQQTFVLTIESSAFVACDAGESAFSNENLPDHLEKTYFVLFLLVHVQRFALTGLSARIVTTTTEAVQPRFDRDLRSQLARIVELDRELLEFTARSYYLQVSQQYHHHRYYDTLRKLVQIESLFGEINTEISSLKSFVNSLVQQEADRRANLVQLAVMAVTAIFVPAGVLLALFAPKIRSWPGIESLSPVVSMWLTFSVLMALVVSMLALHSLYRKSSGESHRRRDKTVSPPL